MVHGPDIPAAVCFLISAACSGNSLFISGTLSWEGWKRRQPPTGDWDLNLNFSECQENLFGNLPFYLFLNTIVVPALCVEKPDMRDDFEKF